MVEQDAAGALVPGQPIGKRYVVEKLLDRGGMGSVYVAHDRDLDRSVALKVLPSEQWDDPRAVERFMRQARALARIEHRAVLRVYDRGLHDDRMPYVVTERLTGSNLQVRLQVSRLSARAAVELAIELCEAVQAVHAQGVLHRDLKPSNVFLADDSGREQLKLLDFGIAKMDDAVPLTGTQDLLGTFAYMAPERLEPGAEEGVASDVYAIACVSYEMLAGVAPFRARSRAELLAAIAHDPVEPLRARGLPIPDELDTAIVRALSKRPAERPASARDFGAELSACLAGLAPHSSGRTSVDRSELAAGRYQLQEKLGEGRFGVVYAALDRRHGSRVALKRLRSLHSDDLYRLKREFRVLADLDHPNLVKRFELVADGDEAFFTMELLQGQPVLEAMRAVPLRAPWLLHQLATGLGALHSRGWVHRDLKPSNVIVGADERVVLLDFGLTVSADSHSHVAGTPSYMAPEARNGEIGSAADMYALGVIMRELLADQPESLSGLGPLSQALLVADPAQRPAAAELALQLERVMAFEPPRAAADDGLLFVGRSAELAVLRRALDRVATGTPGCVLVRGGSGIGKSALAQRALRELAGRALCLSSACRDSESVPYPALDAAIDGLADQLAALPRESAALLMPRNAHALAQLFPVLQRVPSLSGGGELPMDPAQVRTLAYAALHRLLQLLAERRPIVLFIDDLHWIDQDSAALLAYLLARPDPPALLLVGAVRSDLEQHPSYARLRDALQVHTEVLTLGELDASDSRAVVASLLPAALDQLSARIVEHSAGHPFLLSLLARHARQAGAEPDLDHALADLLKSLDAPTQRLLVLICVSERPLPLELLLQAAGGVELEHARQLRRARLARRLHVAGRESLEPYHVRVREAVLRALSLASRRDTHRALAAALGAEQQAWPEALVEHLAGSGENQQAALVATRAARAAQEQLAFERAAALYSIALRHAHADAAERVEWLQLRAAALRNAGRSVEAAEALHDASALVTGEQSVRLARQSGELLLFAGEIAKGLALLGPLLARVGLELPRDANDAIARGLSAFASLSERGLSRVARSAPAEPEARIRTELSLSLADGLALVDLRGIPFALSAVSLALDLDDAPLLQHALATFATLTASLFPNPLIDVALGLCRELTLELNTPHARALLYAAEGEAAQFTGRTLVAEAAFEQAERILLESCVGTTRELAAVRNGAALIEYAQKGDFVSQLERTLAWQSSAEVRRDVFHENVLRIAHSIVWIAHDDPQKARAELERAALAFKEGSGAYEVGMLEFWDVIDRYEGRADAHLRPLQGRRDILESPAAATPYLAGYIQLQRAWGAIRALARGEHIHDERAISERAIAALRALEPDVWQAIADAMQANLVYLAGERDRSLELLRQAESTFHRMHMRGMAVCARLRRGELSGRVLGDRLVQEAYTELTQLGIKRPERWTLAYFSLFDPDTPSDLTLLTRY